MELSIGFINDVHGYLEPHADLFYNENGEYVKTVGGYAKIATIFEKIRNENKHCLFFDGGDTFHGTLPVVASKGETLVPILNQLGLHGMVGHWDFAYSPNHLQYLANQLHYPTLGINVYKDDGSLLLKPYTIIDTGTEKIAVIGICANIIDKTMTKTFSEGIYVTDGSKEISKYIEEVKTLGASVVILLSHNGYPQDIALLHQNHGIDICLSAHTHNRLYQAVKVKQTLVIQCGCHGSFVGHLKLSIDKGQISDYSYELLEVAEHIATNENISIMVNEIMRPYRSMQSQVVGQTDQILHRYSNFSSTMDELLLKAIKVAAGTQIAFSNGWRYGIPIDKGDITLWNLYNMVPMNPLISIANMTGQEIKDMMEENFERTFSANPMKQMGGYCKRWSGLRINFHIENPAGYRIEEIYFKNEHLKCDEIYKVAYITEQGVPDHYGSDKEDLEITAVQALIAYLQNQKY